MVLLILGPFSSKTNISSWHQKWYSCKVHFTGGAAHSHHSWDDHHHQTICPQSTTHFTVVYSTMVGSAVITSVRHWEQGANKPLQIPKSSCQERHPPSTIIRTVFATLTSPFQKCSICQCCQQIHQHPLPSAHITRLLWINSSSWRHDCHFCQKHTTSDADAYTDLHTCKTQR